ncbi:hypothetical protein Tco_0370634 [Tanacetum coccineum]
MVKGDDEIKLLAEFNVELEFGTHKVAEEVVEMANDQDEALFVQEVADDSLDDEEVKEGRPNKRIRSSKKRWSMMK